MTQNRKQRGLYLVLILCLITASRTTDLFADETISILDLLNLFVCGTLFGVFLAYLIPNLRERMGKKVE